MKAPKIIQLTTPLERFQKFDRKADQALKILDDLGELYVDLGFRESDIEDYSAQQANDLKEELEHHGQLILFLLHHPLVEVLREKRAGAENGETQQLFEVPTGVWQHYKGTQYQILGPMQSTDFHLPGIIYQEVDKPNSRIYTITLVNFYRTVAVNGENVKRFVQISK